MARSLQTVPRAGGLGPAAVIVVLLAILAAVVSPSAQGNPDFTDSAALTPGVAQAAGEPHADDGHFAVRNALVRGHRDIPDERLSPPVTATLASCIRAYCPPQSAHTSLPTANRPASPHLTGRHQGRAPPPASGT